MRYRYLDVFRRGISVFAIFSYGIAVLGTPQCPPLQMVDVSQNRFSSTNHGKQWPEIRPFSGEQELVNSLPEFHRTFQHNG